MERNQKDQYLNRFKNIGLSQQQLEQKWKARLDEERMFEAMARQAAQQLMASGASSAPADSQYSEGAPPPPPPTPPPPPPPTPPTPPPPPPPHVAGLDFTIEFWMKATDWGAAGRYHPRIFSIGPAPAWNAISIESGGGHAYWWTAGTHPVDAAYSFNTNTWYHVAVTRNNGTLAMYVDGNQLGTGTLDTNISSHSLPLIIGAEPVSPSGYDEYFNGKITNLRWTDSAVYSGTSFTVPTSPLTALTNTKLLLLATNNGGVVADGSTYARTATNSSVTWSSDSPFSGGVGGSMVFNASAYLSLPASTDWYL
jgi:hypothetical protein